jgi:hypothetical protein
MPSGHMAPIDDDNESDHANTYQCQHTLEPLDLGSSSLMPRRVEGEVGVTCENRHINRPSSSSLQGLVPLRLGPVVLRDAPSEPDESNGTIMPATVPDSTDAQRPRSDSMQRLLDQTLQDPYLDTRDTPFQRCSRRSTDLLAMIPTRSTDDNTTTRQTISTQSSSSSLRRQANETKTNHAQSFTEGSRPASRLKRKHSDQLIRKTSSRSTEAAIEQEILELTTIVEERRAEAARSGTPDGHVPAVAPLMKVRARSETLTDIGSAFSRPATSGDISQTRGALEARSRPTRPASSYAQSRSSSRIAGWLSSIITSSDGRRSSHLDEPFYKCQPPAGQHQPASRNSECSSDTELNSPSLTLASSPTATSTGHSRNVTMESRLTSPEPADLVYDANHMDRKRVEAFWRAKTPSLVGVAM